MPDLTPCAADVCPHCDGFPVVAVTTGEYRADRSLVTYPVICPKCSGTGLANPFPVLVADAATAVFARR